MTEKVCEMFTQYDDVVSVEEVMDMLHLGRVTVYGLLKSGKIKALKFGRKYIIPKKTGIMIPYLDVLKIDLEERE